MPSELGEGRGERGSGFSYRRACYGKKRLALGPGRSNRDKPGSFRRNRDGKEGAILGGLEPNASCPFLAVVLGMVLVLRLGLFICKMGS